MVLVVEIGSQTRPDAVVVSSVLIVVLVVVVVMMVVITVDKVDGISETVVFAVRVVGGVVMEALVGNIDVLVVFNVDSVVKKEEDREEEDDVLQLELPVVLRLEELREVGDVCKVVAFEKSIVTDSVEGISVDTVEGKSVLVEDVDSSSKVVDVPLITASVLFEIGPVVVDDIEVVAVENVDSGSKVVDVPLVIASV